MSSEDFSNDLSNLSMLELFRMEVETQASTLNQGLLDIEHVKPSAEKLETLMRASHSIKGAARMVNINAVVQLAHLIEDCFVALQKGEFTLDEKDVDKLLAGVDLILQISQTDDGKIENWIEENRIDYQHMENALKSISQYSTFQNQDESDLKSANKESSGITQFDNIGSKLSDFATEKTDNRQSTLRISIDRLDKFLNLAGKSLVETHQLSALLPSFWQLKHKQQLLISDVSKLQEALSEDVDREQIKQIVKNLLLDMNTLRHQMAENIAQLDAIDRRTSTISDHLHREIMSSRMRPISEILGGLPRMVRDLGRHLRKEVRLRMSGISCLVDRHVLEKIDTPIKHLVQNAIDHGIEYPAEREALGKSSLATISLTVSINAGMLSIVIEDDGRGVDMENLKLRIVDKGLASVADLESMDSSEILNYLFYPGVTTKASVDDISGRGVGLDLVKDALSDLHGIVYASSVDGHGMKFQLVLPLTVSVLRVMLVAIGGESYAFPMSSIERIQYAGMDEIVEMEGKHYLYLDGEPVPLIHANTVFECPLPKQLPPLLTVLMVENKEKKYGLVVERVDGEQEVSIHKLSSELGKVRGINSAAILNNGALSLIVEVEEFVSTVDSILRQEKNIRLYQEEWSSVQGHIRVLVVDDSLTVREMEKKLLSRLQCEIFTAEDGLEALKVLSEQTIDIVVTDIDMPNMNGIQLINELRYQPIYEKLPILIVSNRERAFIEQNMALNETISFLPKDQFSPKIFLDKFNELSRLVVLNAE